MFEVENTMSKIEKLDDLVMWQKAIQLAVAVYKIDNAQLIKDFSFRDQIRKAAVSVSSNIAEGFGRGGNSEFVQFLSIAKGSLYELKTQLIIALEIDYITKTQFEELNEVIEEISKLIAGMMSYLKASDYKGHKKK
jgi:four helix bundle protein